MKLYFLTPSETLDKKIPLSSQLNLLRKITGIKACKTNAYSNLSITPTAI